MKIRKRVTIAIAAVAGMVLTGCQTTGVEEANDVEVGSFSHWSDLDIIKQLPNSPADDRIFYDEFPLTFGDLRLPRGDSRPDEGYPVVVIIHGGQWESSYSLDFMARMAEALSNAGVATWNVEFRRLNNPGGAYPGLFLDVAKGIDFVRELSTQYPLDLDNVVLMGHSSGGHLATWAAGRANIPDGHELHSENPLPVKGVIDLAGVLDLEYAFDAGRTDILNVLGVAERDELVQRAEFTSSINLFPTGVPQTLIIGSDDSEWRIESHDRYVAAGQAAGDSITLEALDGANHFDVVDPCTPAWGPIVTAVYGYIDKPIADDVRDLDAELCAPKATS